jgi:hypothetical protein
MRPLASNLMLALLLVPGSPSHGADEQSERDVLVLTSGNRLTGEIRALSRGELSFSIDGAGVVDIDWNNVERLHSARELHIELATGERLSGPIESPRPGTLQGNAERTGTKTVDMNDVVSITPIATRLRDNIRGSIDFGFDFLNANDELDLTLNAEAQKRTRSYMTQVSLRSLLRRLDGGTAQRRNDLTISSRRFGANRWFVLGQFEAEENRELDLDLRLLLGGAVGRTLLQSNRSVVAVYGGIDYVLEEYRDIPGTDDLAEALAAVEWDWFELGGSTELSLAATAYASLERSRTRVELDASLRRDIVNNFYWSLSLYESYISDPPPARETSDFGVALTFGRSF